MTVAFRVSFSTRLPETLRRIEEISRKYNLQIGNIFHAGDGNLHPLILFDERDREQFARVVAAGGEIMRHCIEVGGALTGEHGIGLGKIPYLADDLGEAVDVMRSIKAALDPQGLMNPGKIFSRGARA